MSVEITLDVRIPTVDMALIVFAAKGTVQQKTPSNHVKVIHWWFDLKTVGFVGVDSPKALNQK